MRKILAAIAAGLSLATAPLGCFAAITGQPSVVGTSAQPVTMYAPSYTNYAGAGSALVVVKGSPGILARIINTNTAAQTVTFTCYDNASAASGTVLWAGVMAASQIIDVGIQAKLGIVCKPSAATLSGNGINVTDF